MLVEWKELHVSHRYARIPTSYEDTVFPSRLLNIQNVFYMTSSHIFDVTRALLPRRISSIKTKSKNWYELNFVPMQSIIWDRIITVADKYIHFISANGSKASDCCLFVIVWRLATDNMRSSPDFLYSVNVIARYWHFVVSIRRVVSSHNKIETIERVLDCVRRSSFANGQLKSKSCSTQLALLNSYDKVNPKSLFGYYVQQKKKRICFILRNVISTLLYFYQGLILIVDQWLCL